MAGATNQEVINSFAIYLQSRFPAGFFFDFIRRSVNGNSIKNVCLTSCSLTKKSVSNQQLLRIEIAKHLQNQIYFEIRNRNIRLQCMKKLKKVFLFLIVLISIGYLLPNPFSMPVKGASKNSYNQESFWAYPWGTSVTHKGVDIFAKEGTEVIAPTNGLIIHTGTIEKGGNIIVLLGSKWRFHYFAHLREIKTSSFSYVKANKVIGTVGTTGNAKGKSPHLHYTIRSLIPLPWKIDHSIQGWKKMFYLNPIPLLNKASN